jgi:hypothetical protein
MIWMLFCLAQTWKKMKTRRPILLRLKSSKSRFGLTKKTKIRLNCKRLKKNGSSRSEKQLK